MKDWMDREAKKYQDKNARKGLMLQYQWGVLVLKARLKENLMNATSHSTGGTAEETLDVTEFQKPAMDLLNAYLSACSDPDFVDPSSSKNNNGAAGRAGARIAEQSVLNTEVGEALGISSMSSKAFPDSMKNRDEILTSCFSPDTGRPAIFPPSGGRGTREFPWKWLWEKSAMPFPPARNPACRAASPMRPKTKLMSRRAAVLDRLRWRCELDCFDLGDQANATRNMMTLIRTTVDPVRREQGIRTLRDKLVQSMKSMMDSPEEESMADGSSSSSAPRPAMRSSKKKAPSTTITTSREMDDPGAIGTDVPKPPKPAPTRSDDFLKTSDFLQTKDVARTAVSLFMECAEHP